MQMLALLFEDEANDASASLSALPMKVKWSFKGNTFVGFRSTWVKCHMSYLHLILIICIYKVWQAYLTYIIMHIPEPSCPG